MTADVDIRPARTSTDYEIAGGLIDDYAAALGVDLTFQHFAFERAHLEQIYGPPRGRLLLAWGPEGAAGCVGLRSAGADVCEMKRLYVTPAFRSSGLGRRLALQIIDDARVLGYRRMVLDTLASMHAAHRLYASLGFTPIAPYYDNPLPGTVFLGCDL